MVLPRSFYQLAEKVFFSKLVVQAMKLIAAIVKPFKVDDVRHAELYRGSEYVVDFLPKVRLEIASDAAAVEAIINAITVSAHTGKSGDEKYLSRLLIWSCA